MPLSEVQVAPEPIDRFAPLLGEEAMIRLRAAADASREALTGRTVWNVNSTASGGGVAEMLQVLLAYGRGVGVDTRWLVVSGEPAFFRITKRLHNVLHGSPGDGGPLGAEEEVVYRNVLEPQGAELVDLVEPDDIVLLHDPQTAGLAAALQDSGAAVLWRCHIGADVPNEHTERGVDFLRPHLERARRYIFSRQQHVHPWIPHDRVTIIPPSIDPFAPKNAEMDAEAVRAIVGAIAFAETSDQGAALYRRRDGSPARVARKMQLVRGDGVPSLGDPVVVQVSRWDRLKDMAGVLRGFALHAHESLHLALVGPAIAGVTDDPEGAEVLDECAGIWETLDASMRARVRLICLPMEDVEENAAMVNAIQRHAAVVVQKSLAEGFGLTVTEAMWKARPVIASGIGGITDQIVDGESGLLLKDPTDLDAFGEALNRLLGSPAECDRLGAAARARVTADFLGNRHLVQYASLFAGL